MFSHGNRDKKEIAITLDDGPSEETEQVLEILKKYNVKATFFVVGEMITGRENVVRRAKEAGHEFENHTYSHKRLWFRSAKFIEEEVTKCDEELAKLGIETDLLRFPGLKYGPSALKVCKKLKKKIISADMNLFDWTSHDWFNPWLKKLKITKGQIKLEKVVNKTISRARNGSIIAFHDYLHGIGPHPEIVLILERVILELRKRGFEFVTVSELLFKKISNEN